MKNAQLPEDRPIPPPRLTARVNKQKLYLMLAGSVVAYGVLYFFLSRVEMIILGFCVVIAIIYGLKQLLVGDSRVVVDERGVFDSRLGFGTIRWRDITNVYVTEFNSIPHVCLELVDPNRYLKSRSMAVKGLLKFHEKKNKITPFNINTGVLDTGPSDIYDAIQANWQFYVNKQFTRSET